MSSTFLVSNPRALRPVREPRLEQLENMENMLVTLPVSRPETSREPRPEQPPNM